MQSLPRDILHHPAIWRGSQYARVSHESIPTGSAQLDMQLPGAGWPRGALTEILVDRQGLGEFSLLAPALARLSKSSDWIVLVAPPHIPYAPALISHGIDLKRLVLIHPGNARDNLWAAERCLRSRSCSAVIYWASGQTEHTLCRRLQWAAEASSAWAVVFRAAHWARHTSPAALRLMLEIEQNRLKVHLLKRRGGGGSSEIFLDMRDRGNPAMTTPTHSIQDVAPQPRSHRIMATCATVSHARAAKDIDRWGQQVA